LEESIRLKISSIGVLNLIIIYVVEVVAVVVVTSASVALFEVAVFVNVVVSK